MKSLYRRYRPLKLEDVVGQEQVTGPLTSALKANKVSHAYLFIGPRGTGKTSVARIFAHEVNGFTYTLEDDYVDIIEIDGASNRGIDNIRDLREKVAIAPTAGKYKVYIIDEVHMLTKEAFNALLKTLEEPPKHAIFIMATTDAYKVPVTITSRAQVFNFKLADPGVMVQHLKNICEKEGLKISDDALEIIVRRGGGSYRDTLSLLDQISTLSDKEITRELVVRALGLPADDKIEALLKSYLGGGLENIAAELREIYASGIEARTLTDELMNKIIAEPRPEYISLLERLADVKAPYEEARLLVALGANLAVAPRIAPAHLERPDSYTTSAPVQPRVEAPVATPVVKSPEELTVATQEPVNEPTATFDWERFIEKVHAMNDAIYAQLKTCGHSLSGNVIELYPPRRVVKTILSSRNNQKILYDAAEGMVFKIHNEGEDPNVKKDALLSKMSDIMGGEVKNDAGGNPF